MAELKARLKGDTYHVTCPECGQDSISGELLVTFTCATCEYHDEHPWPAPDSFATSRPGEWIRYDPSDAAIFAGMQKERQERQRQIPKVEPYASVYTNFVLNFVNPCLACGGQVVLWDHMNDRSLSHSVVARCTGGHEHEVKIHLHQVSTGSIYEHGRFVSGLIDEITSGLRASWRVT